MKPLTPIESYAVINALADQAIGRGVISSVDATNFVSVGDQILATGTDNVINSISILITRVINKSRAYQAKYATVMTDAAGYGNRILKRKTYSKKAIAAGNVNTDANTNIGDGLNAETSGVGSQWEMSFAPALEISYGGSDVWSYQMPTITEDALRDAFRNEAEFAAFMTLRMTEAYNEIESEKEAFARMTVLNRIAGVVKMVNDEDLGSECVVDLIAYANKKMGTSYTTQQMLQSHQEEFLKLVAVKLAQDSSRLESRTNKYHWSPAKQVGGVDYELVQHTPKSAQKFLYYEPLISEMETRVLPTIFHAEMLKSVVDKSTAKAEGLDFWQAFDDSDEYAGAKIDWTPAIPEGTTAEVELPFVFGILYDEDGIMINYQLDNVRSTPVHARKGIINTFANFKRLPINDFTENAIVYTLGPATFTDTFAGTGSKTKFTLTGNVTTLGDVYVGTTKQVLNTDYTYADGEITFTVAPANKAVIKASYV